jgi:hypothetical protein
MAGLYLLVEAMLALHGTTKRSLIVGILCDMFNIAMYVSPLTVMVSNFYPINLYTSSLLYLIEYLIYIPIFSIG